MLKRGGRGYKLKGYETGKSLPTTTQQQLAALAAPQQPAASAPATPPASKYPARSSQQPTMLPTSSLLPQATKLRLARLSALYAELQHTQLALSYSQQYLPRLRTNGGYLTDSLSAHLLKLEAEIAAIATKPEGSTWPSSPSKPTKE